MQDSDLEYLIWQFDKRIILSEKKPPLVHTYILQYQFAVKMGEFNDNQLSHFSLIQEIINQPHQF